MIVKIFSDCLSILRHARRPLRRPCRRAVSRPSGAGSLFKPGMTASNSRWKSKLPIEWMASADDLQALRRIFDGQSQRLYAFSRPEAPIEIITWRLQVRLPSCEPEHCVEGCGRSTSSCSEHDGALRWARPGGDGRFRRQDNPARNDDRRTSDHRGANDEIVMNPGIYGRLSRNGNYIFERGASHV